MKPCQPFSLAGARKGTDDPRHIWPRIADAIRILRPRICVFENVAAHLTLGFDHVLTDLASLGMDVRWGVVSAREAGAPHNRKRLWIVATDADSARGFKELDCTTEGELQSGRHTDGRSVEVAWGIYERAIKQWESILDRPAPNPAQLSVTGMPQLTAKFVEWLMGLPDGHVTDVDIPRTQQLKILGNGVVPQQAALALQLLARPDGLVAARERSTK